MISSASRPAVLLRRRLRKRRALVQRILEVDGYPVFFQYVGEGFVCQFLDRRHAIASKLLELVEGVIVESNQLAHALAGSWIVAAPGPNRDRGYLFQGKPNVWRSQTGGCTRGQPALPKNKVAGGV
jgi:hypothetical protein